LDISIIIPIYNEEKYVENLAMSILCEDGIQKEIFFVDGQSTDKTIEILNDLKKKYSNIYIIENSKMYVSFGFNKAFPLTQGKYITLLGAHAIYPKGFFKIAFEYLEKNECDVVGGPLIQVGKGIVGESIAYAMSSKFGVGGTEFRTESKKQFVDSVAFAVYKKEIFNKIGLLDEQLIRNQDDELHYRINSKGYKILMVPEMACTYFVRNNIRLLFRQYFQYGLYKPLVFKKVKSGMRLRHIIPALFCMYLVTLIPFSIINILYAIPIVLYLLMLVIVTIKSKLSFRHYPFIVSSFFTLHFSYGMGFLLGLFRKNK